MKKSLIALTVSSALTGFAFTVHAGSINELTNFTAGTPARAAEVNGNFAAVRTAVNDNDARIIALEAANAALERSNTALYQANATIRNRLTALETLLANVSLQTVNDHLTLRFSGVNVQVVNGMGNTNSVNGLGNLIVGYDEPDPSGNYRCTIGVYPTGGQIVTSQATCLEAGGNWVNTGFKTGSHFIVAGSENNYSNFGGVVFGSRNTVNGPVAVVTGGVFNVASAYNSSVSGGSNNSAFGYQSSISGGDHNVATGAYSSITGGYYNTASGFLSSVSGGAYNKAIGNTSHVSGGGNGTDAGGNVADTYNASILGGVGQNTSTHYQTIPALP